MCACGCARQRVDQPPQDRRRIADQRDGGLAMLRGLLRIGIHRDDREIIVDAPHRVLEEQPRADREHHVGFAPQFVAERQRDGERIARSRARPGRGGSRTAPAPAASRQVRDFRRGILRAAADHDHRIFRGAETLRGIAQRVLVDRRLLRRAAAGCGFASPGLPHTLIAHSSAAGPGRPVTPSRGKPRRPCAARPRATAPAPNGRPAAR